MTAKSNNQQRLEITLHILFRCTALSSEGESDLSTSLSLYAAHIMSTANITADIWWLLSTYSRKRN